MYHYNEQICKQLLEWDNDDRLATITLKLLYKEWSIVEQRREFIEFIRDKQSSSKQIQEEKCQLIVNLLRPRDTPLKHIHKCKKLNSSYAIYEDIISSDYIGICQAIFDQIDNELERTLAIQFFRKSWSSHKHRSKNEGKKQYTFTLHPDIKSKLDTIVDNSPTNIGDTLAALIENEYARLKKNKR